MKPPYIQPPYFAHLQPTYPGEAGEWCIRTIRTIPAEPPYGGFVALLGGETEQGVEATAKLFERAPEADAVARQVIALRTAEEEYSQNPCAVTFESLGNIREVLDVLLGLWTERVNGIAPPPVKGMSTTGGAV